MRFFVTFILSYEEIRIYPISGTFLYLSESLVDIILFPLNNLILYLMLSGSLVFILTISLCPSFIYPRESPILKGWGVVLVCVESLLTLFHVLTQGLSNLYETAYLITSSSTSGVKSIGLPVFVSYLVHM